MAAMPRWQYFAIWVTHNDRLDDGRKATAEARVGFFRFNPLLHRWRTKLALDSHRSCSRSQHYSDLDLRLSMLFCASGGKRPRTLRALSARRWPLRLDSTRLRRLLRFSCRMDLLDEKPSLLPGGALLRCGQPAVCLPAWTGAIRQSQLLFAVFLSLPDAHHDTQRPWPEVRKMAQQSWRIWELASNHDSARARCRKRLAIWLRHRIYGSNDDPARRSEKRHLLVDNLLRIRRLRDGFLHE